MTLAFDLPVTSIEIAGEATRFPVRRIYCVGRNYAAHIAEMGFDPNREEPFFFLKPSDAIVPSGGTIPYPPQTANYHHEVELVIAIGGSGKDVAVADARALIFGYAVGLDMTRRDVQLAARDRGRPWDMGKSSDHSAPCGALVRAEQVPAIDDATIRLTVNGAERQASTLKHLIWSIDEIVADLSRFVELAPGDLIYTGTPEGVGAVVAGDRLVATIDGLPPLDVAIG